MTVSKSNPISSKTHVMFGVLLDCFGLGEGVVIYKLFFLTRL
ncbi:MAG: hypothetical protein U9O20_02245 [Patescibacteria group bacterium]|nr:hypothetical protein [Patescibacteria group bacterium]